MSRDLVWIPGNRMFFDGLRDAEIERALETRLERIGSTLRDTTSGRFVTKGG